MRGGGEPRHGFGELRQTGNHSVRKGGIVLFPLAVDPDPPDAKLGRRPDVVVVALRDVYPLVWRASEDRLEALEMRMVGFVSGDVLGRDNGVKRLRQPALGERDEVAIAVGQQGQLPSVGVECTQRRSDVWKNGPVGNGRRERRGVVVLEVELE